MRRTSANSGGLEVACFNEISALIAAKAGAARIELCVGRRAGGLTPPSTLVEILLQQLTIPLVVMIRPRPGDFSYSASELKRMMADIASMKEFGVHGIVSGVLSKEEVDYEATARLIEACGELPFIFHRAIDEVADQRSAIEKLRAMGVKRVLTSGGKGNAIDNISSLRSLHEAFGDLILPGGGIRADNAEAFTRAGFTSLHSSCIGDDDVADREEVKALVKVLGT